MMIEREIGKILREKNFTIAIAESCTGGLIAHRITNIPGASRYFEMGIVTYSNRSKEKFLSVAHDTIVTDGAVSEHTARQMAEGIRRIAGVHIGLSVTGIAGPHGGSIEKPLGTVYIALSSQDGVFVRRFLFHGKRIEIKRQTSEEALKLVHDYLTGNL